MLPLCIARAHETAMCNCVYSTAVQECAKDESVG